MCYHTPWRGRHRKRLVCILWGTVCRNNSAIVSSYVYSSNIRENTNRLYATRRSTSKLMEGPWELLPTSQWRCPIEDRYINKGCSVVSELFERNPESVIAKNFRASVSAFKDLPTGQLWIFPGTPAPKDIQGKTPPAPLASSVNDSYGYHLSQQESYEVLGGSIKVTDPATLPIASTFSAALVTVQPGGTREIHWYTTSDEWTYFLERVRALDGISSSCFQSYLLLCRR